MQHVQECQQASLQACDNNGFGFALDWLKMKQLPSDCLNVRGTLKEFTILLAVEHNSNQTK